MGVGLGDGIASVGVGGGDDSKSVLSQTDGSEEVGSGGGLGAGSGVPCARRWEDSDISSPLHQLDHGVITVDWGTEPTWTWQPAVNALLRTAMCGHPPPLAERGVEREGNRSFDVPTIPCGRSSCQSATKVNRGTVTFDRTH